MTASETKRDRRRRDLERMKAKARRIYADRADRAVKWADYLAVCSCAVCGNPRRYWKSGAMKASERRAVEAAAARD